MLFSNENNVDVVLARMQIIAFRQGNHEMSSLASSHLGGTIHHIQSFVHGLPVSFMRHIYRSISNHQRSVQKSLDIE